MEVQPQPVGTTKLDISVRPLQENDLSAADRIMRLAFGTFLGLPEPTAFMVTRATCGLAGGPTRLPHSVPKSVASSWALNAFSHPSGSSTHISEWEDNCTEQRLPRVRKLRLTLWEETTATNYQSNKSDR